MSKSWASGSSRQWRRTRAAVLARDGHRCRIRIEGICTTVATQVHHTIGRCASGDNPDHLVAACAACNGHIGHPHTDPPPTPRTRW